jgi:hypothetical protein
VGATRQRLAVGTRAGGLNGPRWATRSCWAAARTGWKQAAGANGLQNENGLKRGRSGAFKKKGFYFFQTHSNNEFKQEFEFKHPKMMHQHVCNSKLLYFVIKLRKMIKCLEKHNLLIFLKRERIVAKKILIKHKRWNLGCYKASDGSASCQYNSLAQLPLLLSPASSISLSSFSSLLIPPRDSPLQIFGHREKEEMA